MLEKQPIGLEKGRVPSMASRIFAGLSELGDFEMDNTVNWSLRLTTQEHETATQALVDWEGRDEFVAFSIGTKWPENDWGDEKWRQVFEIVSDRRRAIGLIAVGAPGESDRSAQLRFAADFRSIGGEVAYICLRYVKKSDALLKFKTLVEISACLPVRRRAALRVFGTVTHCFFWDNQIFCEIGRI